MDQQILKLLLLCLQENAKHSHLAAPFEKLSSEDWQKLVDYSYKLRANNNFYKGLKKLGLGAVIPADQHARLRKTYLNNAVRNLIFRNELAQVARICQSVGISLIVLKGAFLSEFVYQDSASREMSDIDLLVKLDELGEAAKSLESMGYKAEQPYSIEDITTVAHHLPPFTSPGKGTIELHWNIITLVGNVPVDADGLWERSQCYDFNGAKINGLCPEDLLLHICGHASYHHKFEVGLQALFDIQAIINHYSDIFDWQQFISRAFDWKWDRGVYLTLRLAKELLGAAVPDEVLRELQPKNFHPYLLEIARSQMLSDDPLIGTITYPFADWHVAGLWKKISIFWQRWFLPKPLLADRFKILPNSLIIYLYYPVRFFDLLIRYARPAYNLWKGNQVITPFVERKGLLQEWLQGGKAGSQNNTNLT